MRKGDEIIRPRAIAPGATLGVFTPSTPANVHFREKYLHGLAQIEALGFRWLEGDLTASMKQQGYRAAGPRERAAELMSLVENPSVDAIVATIGGLNSSSLIPYLDFDAIRASPKILLGYSDVTSLHLAILAHSGVSTFYGPAVMPSFGEWPAMIDETRDLFLDAVWRHTHGARRLPMPRRWSSHFRDAKGEAWRTVPREWQSNDGWRILRVGTASGDLVVANLNTLMAAAGTPYFPDVDGCILLVEEMSAPMGIEERSLRQLERIGVFDRIAGLIVGRPEFFDAQGAPFTYDELILEVVGERGYPIVTDFDCGHTHPMITLAERTPITLDATGARAEVVIERPMVVGEEGRWIYHFAVGADVESARESGVYRHASLARDGFIHCSPHDLVCHVATVNMRGRDDLVLLEIDSERVERRIVWENLEGGTRMFPHIYGELSFGAIERVVPFPASTDGSFTLPASIDEARRARSPSISAVEG
jgi:muramoyltetrapeptide carboxypeptidase